MVVAVAERWPLYYRGVISRVNVWTVHWGKKKKGCRREVAVSGGPTYSLTIHLNYIQYNLKATTSYKHIYLETVLKHENHPSIW